MSKEGSPNGVPQNPFDTPAYLHRELARLIAEYDVEEQRILQKLQPTHDTATFSEIHTELEAMAFNADLTFQQLQEVFQTYGSDAPAILECLTQDKAHTPEEAHALLMKQAGDEAGKQLVDPIRKAMDARFKQPKSPAEHKLREMDRHGVRKWHHKGKRDVTRMYEGWRQQQDWQKKDDAAFQRMVDLSDKEKPSSP